MSQTTTQQPVAEDTGGEVKLPLLPLIAFGVGSMVGAGIFALPQQMAAVAAPGPLILGWIITGIGMLALAFAYQSLNKTRPDVKGGVYGYARESLGNYGGFASAWSYWLSAWAGNLSYVTIFVGALGGFSVFSFLVDDDGVLTISGLILAIAIIWVAHFLILAGIRTAAFVNTIVTLVKIIPVVIFILCTAVAFKAGVFTADFWGNVVELGEGKDAYTLGSALSQISKMMLLTVWVFIGIEGAAVYSTRAKKDSDVGKATVIAFLTVLAMLVFSNVLSYGIMAQPELAGLNDPSMAEVMTAAVGGAWGGVFINVALLISVAGAILTWIMLAAEILYVPAGDFNLKRSFTRTNSKGSPTVSLWVTNSVSTIVLILVVTMFSADYTDMITIAASLILPCYVVSAWFQIKQTVTDDKTAPGATGNKATRMVIGVIAFIYTLWLTWAGGIALLFLNGLMWLIGTPLYMIGRREKGEKPFQKNDAILLVAFIILAVLLFVWVPLFDNPVDALFWNGL